MTSIDALTVFGLVLTFILGYLGRYWQYEWRKKSLRDEKFLEGKISVIHEFIGYVGEMDSRTIYCITLIKENDKKNLNELYTQLCGINLMYNSKLNKLLFYLEDTSAQTVVNYGRIHKEFVKWVRKFINEEEYKITEKDFKYMEKVIDRISDAFDDTRAKLHAELGFDKIIPDVSVSPY